MGLLSFFKRKSDAPAAKPVTDKADSVQVLRVRARHRLIGAAVLVAVGVVGFPVIFATQPRPLPVDLPIDIPKKDTAPALAVPAEVRTAPDAASSSGPAATDAPQSLAASTPTQVQAPPTRTAQAPEAQPAPVVPVPVAEPKAETKPETKSDTKTQQAKADTPKPAPSKSDAAKSEAAHAAAKPAARDAGDAARAQALLDGKSPAGASAANQAANQAADKAADKGRFIVQVGAFADVKAAHDVRAKVEHLGLKTYTQAVDTSAGKRIRVRIGPFASRDDAQQAATKLHNSGLTAAVLTL